MKTRDFSKMLSFCTSIQSTIARFLFLVKCIGLGIRDDGATQDDVELTDFRLIIDLLKEPGTGMKGLHTYSTVRGIEVPAKKVFDLVRRRKMDRQLLI